jgi:WD40 repeat protein
VATGGDDAVARLWDVEALELLRQFEGHSDSVTCGDLSPDGSLLATGSRDRTLILWEVATARQVATSKGHDGEIVSLRFGPEGKRLASASADTTARLWDVETARQLVSIKHPHRVSSVDFSPDGETLLTATMSFEDWQKPGQIKLWNAQTGSEVASLEGHPHNVLCARFGPHGKWVAAGGPFPIHLWDVKTHELEGLLDPIWGASAIDFLPDGQALATCDHFGQLCQWDLGTFQKEVASPAHEDHSRFSIGSLACSPDGTAIATVGKDGFMKLWAAQRGSAGSTGTAALVGRSATPGGSRPGTE